MLGSSLATVLLASVCVACVAGSASFVLWLPAQRLQALLPSLQAAAAGLLLGDALMHMLPEAATHGLALTQIGALLAVGVTAFLAVECVIRSKRQTDSTATFARMDIVGDFLHHLCDGIIIGASFAINDALGALVTLAIMGHEVPREMSNAGVLIAGGMQPRRALHWTLLPTVAIPVGAVLVTVLSSSPSAIARTLAIAAGATIYLACADLLPALWQRLEQRSVLPAAGVPFGLLVMWLVAVLGP